MPSLGHRPRKFQNGRQKALKAWLNGPIGFNCCAGLIAFSAVAISRVTRVLRRCPRLTMNLRLWRSAQNQSPLSSLECEQIIGDIWIFCRQRFDIADFDVDFLYAGPFCARAEKPAPLSDDACNVERIT